MKNEDLKVQEIDLKLSRLKSMFDVLLPLHSQIDRKTRSIQNDIKMLEEERVKLTQGQLLFDVAF